MPKEFALFLTTNPDKLSASSKGFIREFILSITYENFFLRVSYEKQPGTFLRNSRREVCQRGVPGRFAREVYQRGVPGRCTREVYQGGVPGSKSYITL